MSGRFATGALETFYVAIGAGYAWICECFNNSDLLRYDPRTRTVKRFRIIQAPEAWRNFEPLSYVSRTFVIGLDGREGMLWFLAGGTSLVPWNANEGRQMAPSIGLDGLPIQAAIADGKIWVAASSVVDRFSITTGEKEVITLPKGMNATGVAVDPVTDTVWVGNSTGQRAVGRRHGFAR